MFVFKIMPNFITTIDIVLKNILFNTLIWYIENSPLWFTIDIKRKTSEFIEINYYYYYYYYFF